MPSYAYLRTTASTKGYQCVGSAPEPVTLILVLVCLCIRRSMASTKDTVGAQDSPKNAKPGPASPAAQPRKPLNGEEDQRGDDTDSI